MTCKRLVPFIPGLMCSQPACSQSSLLSEEWHGLQVSHIIAPAVLAVYALNLSRISVMDTATLLFGYFLAEKLEPPSLFWGYVATLVAAVFYGYGALLTAQPVHDLPCVAPGEPQPSQTISFTSQVQ